jgi:hypothetical protein
MWCEGALQVEFSLKERLLANETTRLPEMHYARALPRRRLDTIRRSGETARKQLASNPEGSRGRCRMSHKGGTY